MSMVEMIPQRLYVGGKISDQDWEFIQENITAIVNLRTKPDNPPFPFQNRVMLWLPLTVSQTPNLEWLIAVMHQISTLFNSGHSMLIHCRLGMHRSGFIVTAFYMERYGLGRYEALELAKQRKPDLNPPPNYMGLLARYEAFLQGS
ncbi:dual specificity protein phosphatase [Aneurinibacillus sp. Ricciae_BoGa-3]|uniref:dual specificity protein phosphatase family protein n=1 Tax=Aneurinibacillus sp. Ricciae_BoGa-3 TaxID=3022697 RepID=UPI0023416C30|nr:dual specificity protein phosphatase [Aneurinibacillus sp. Ricciae_BoGa-3]WCK56580.1 dual specificity protein phosphatase [Aneurinibacillus sp. Ricciae_BoGa-3]